MEEVLEEELLEALQRDDFCAEPLDDHIARLCLEMGLPEELALGWRDLPDPPRPEAAAPPPPDPGGLEPQPQSSA